ncbi:SH3 domain-containing kinase-binding protein 1 [Syngnathus typhle]|uniref:SH3 domain-containing kinase-binding protein 1 n=1 Tax=Syngnathus typhle TaxID=161592 RepID=UPI002A6A75AA|nr:SH3 domain-containing kinase-binding protein 1 [Syngnathus typhle]
MENTKRNLRVTSPMPQQNSHEANQNGASRPADKPRHVRTQSSASLSPLLPKALSAVLHARQVHVLPRLNLDSEPGPIRGPAEHSSPKLEQLQSELGELREQFEQMKTQHNKEIKLLMSELDEEKRIRLTLQMELQRIKKHMSK